MQQLIWLLLPIAAASGWWMALYTRKKAILRSQARLNSAYGRGLNHLLNEESDKATEVLVRMVEVDPDTFELHLALGSLFRRRGEVDRAIRVHQNIISRSKLSDQLRNQAIFELGRDYLSAGMLDRAEQRFSSLINNSDYQSSVCQHLLDIYQQQKEWGKAVAVADRLASIDSDNWWVRVSHYSCELAQLALDDGKLQIAETWLKKAKDQYPGNVRVLMLRARLSQAKKDYQEAANLYLELESREPYFFAEVYHDWLLCAKQNSCLQAYSDAQRVTLRPVRYRCECCGFSARRLFWQCPGCQQWSSAKPISIGGDNERTE